MFIYKTYLGLFVGGFVATYLLVPVVKWFAIKVGAVDLPDDRKIHTGAIPRMGGLAIAVPFLLSMIGLYFWGNLIAKKVFTESWLMIHLLWPTLIILVVGIADDIWGLPARIKLLGQLAVSTTAYFLGVKIVAITLPGMGEVQLGDFALPITVLWIVGITNAVNLIDGVDGLAAGVGLFVCVCNFLVAFLFGNPGMGILSCALGGSLLAFLRFNFFPAKIFLGDTGSLLLGFSLAVGSIQSSMKGATAVFFLAPVLVLGYPIIDTSLAIARRALKGKPIMSADKGHIHHILLSRGWNQRQVALIAYAATCVLMAVTIMVIVEREKGLIGVLVIAGVVAAVGFRTGLRIVRLEVRRSLHKRRQFKLYHLFSDFIELKLAGAQDVEEAWGIVCDVGKEFKLQSIELELEGHPSRLWKNPDLPESTDGASVQSIELSRIQGKLEAVGSSAPSEDLHVERSMLFRRIAGAFENVLIHKLATA